MSEQYIPNARDAVVGYYGAINGCMRQHCVTCNDKEPLGAYGPTGQYGPDRIYGDLYVATGELSRMEHGDSCDICGVTFLALSEQCQREHDEQQERWRKLPVTHVVEMGMVGAVRCRIY